MGKVSGQLVPYVDRWGKTRYRQRYCPNCGMKPILRRKSYPHTFGLVLMAPLTLGLTLLLALLPHVSIHCSECGLRLE